MNIIFLNKEKRGRAEDIFKIINGKRPLAQYSAEQQQYWKERIPEMLKEAGVTAKTTEEEVISALYKILGGATRTQEQQAKIRARGNISKGKAKKEEEEAHGKDDDEDEEEEEDESDDE